MTTSIELASIVFKIIKQSSIKSVINGDVYLSGNRPLNSDKTDVVIGSLSVPNEILHSGTVLINIYAKDILQKPNYLPDYKVLKSATELILPIFDDKYFKEYNTYIDIEYQRDYKVEGVQEYVSVIRLKTRTINK